jgi:hypothetical protein
MTAKSERGISDLLLRAAEQMGELELMDFPSQIPKNRFS